MKGADVEIVFDRNEKFYFEGRNGVAACTGLRAWHMDDSQEQVYLDFFNSKGNVIRGGGAIPVTALDQFCQQWLQARAADIAGTIKST